MKRINLLSETVYARIAAGEVVVNPASVVKELVENSMDALASAITVEIAQGGTELIRVADNGHGIHPDDMPLTIQKHATSKVAGIADLDSIATLGFRGEALSSIAAVARLTIRSRIHESIEGRELYVMGGGQVQIKPAGLPEGTSVLVENLFYNIPARKKFLKGIGAETTAVTNVVSRLMLARPDISIRFISNGKVIYHSPGSGSLKEIIAMVYGDSIAGSLTEIESSKGPVSVSGYISKASALYKTSRYINLFLNQRYIRSQSIQAALMRGYGERLLRSHYPFAVLHIDLPFDQADINVHPHKLQAMFLNEQNILDAVETAVQDALSESKTPTMQINSGDKVVYQPDTETTVLPEKPPTGQGSGGFSSRPSSGPAFAAQHADYLLKPDDMLQPQGNFEDVMDRIIEAAEIKQTEIQQDLDDVRTMTHYRTVGQAFDAYLIVEHDGALYLIDQHAAHERINYERMKRSLQEGLGMSQLLLIPHMEKFTQENFDLLQAHHDLLQEMGFDYEEFGGLSYRFNAIPAQIEQSGITALLDDVLYELRTSKNDIVLLRDNVVRAACRHSVKAGTTLSGGEIEGLLEEITRMNAIPACPHGRPIAIAITKNELEKGFKRRV